MAQLLKLQVNVAFTDSTAHTYASGAVITLDDIKLVPGNAYFNYSCYPTEAALLAGKFPMTIHALGKSGFISLSNAEFLAITIAGIKAKFKAYIEAINDEAQSPVFLIGPGNTAFIP